MEAPGFFDDEAKGRVAGVIREVEAQTSAELVVAVRRRSGRYREADWLAGALAGLLALCLVLFLPRRFAVVTMPLDVAAGFALGALAAARFPAAARWLVPRAAREQAVRTAARAAFVDMGVSRTRRRGGVLVYASLVEQQVEVVTDVGIDRAKLGPGFAAAVDALGSAARSARLGAFLDGLRALGPVLAAALPREADDENELPDELSAEEGVA